MAGETQHTYAVKKLDAGSKLQDEETALEQYSSSEKIAKKSSERFSGVEVRTVSRGASFEEKDRDYAQQREAVIRPQQTGKIDFKSLQNGSKFASDRTWPSGKGSPQSPTGKSRSRDKGKRSGKSERGNPQQLYRLSITNPRSNPNIGIAYPQQKVSPPKKLEARRGPVLGSYRFHVPSIPEREAELQQEELNYSRCFQETSSSELTSPSYTSQALGTTGGTSTHQHQPQHQQPGPMENNNTTQTSGQLLFPDFQLNGSNEWQSPEKTFNGANYGISSQKSTVLSESNKANGNFVPLPFQYGYQLLEDSNPDSFPNDQNIQSHDILDSSLAPAQVTHNTFSFQTSGEGPEGVKNNTQFNSEQPENRSSYTNPPKPSEYLQAPQRAASSKHCPRGLSKDSASSESLGSSSQQSEQGRGSLADGRDAFSQTENRDAALASGSKRSCNQKDGITNSQRTLDLQNARNIAQGPGSQMHFPNKAYNNSPPPNSNHMSSMPFDKSLKAHTRLKQSWEGPKNIFSPAHQNTTPYSNINHKFQFQNQTDIDQRPNTSKSSRMPWQQIRLTSVPPNQNRIELSRQISNQKSTYLVPPSDWQDDSKSHNNSPGKNPSSFQNNRPNEGFSNPRQDSVKNGCSESKNKPIFFGMNQSVPGASSVTYGYPPLPVPPMGLMMASTYESPSPSPVHNPASSSTCSSISPASTSPVNLSDDSQILKSGHPPPFYHQHQLKAQGSTDYLSTNSHHFHSDASRNKPYAPEMTKDEMISYLHNNGHPKPNMDGNKGYMEGFGVEHHPPPPSYSAHQLLATSLATANLDQLDVLLTCKQCDQNFTNLASFLGHKQYCGQHAFTQKVDDPGTTSGGSAQFHNDMTKVSTSGNSLCQSVSMPRCTSDLHLSLLGLNKNGELMSDTETKGDSKDDPMKLNLFTGAGNLPVSLPDLEMEDAKLDSLITEALNGLIFQSDNAEIDSSFIDAFDADDDLTTVKVSTNRLKTKDSIVFESKRKHSTEDDRTPTQGKCIYDSDIESLQADNKHTESKLEKMQPFELEEKMNIKKEVSHKFSRIALGTKPREREHKVKDIRKLYNGEEENTNTPRLLLSSTFSERCGVRSYQENNLSSGATSSQVSSANKSSPTQRFATRDSKRKRTGAGTWSKELIHKIVQQKNKLNKLHVKGTKNLQFSLVMERVTPTAPNPAFGEYDYVSDSDDECEPVKIASQGRLSQSSRCKYTYTKECKWRARSDRDSAAWRHESKECFELKKAEDVSLSPDKPTSHQRRRRGSRSSTSSEVSTSVSISSDSINSPKSTDRTDSDCEKRVEVRRKDSSEQRTYERSPQKICKESNTQLALTFTKSSKRNNADKAFLSTNKDNFVSSRITNSNIEDVDPLSALPKVRCAVKNLEKCRTTDVSSEKTDNAFSRGTDKITSSDKKTPLMTVVQTSKGEPTHFKSPGSDLMSHQLQSTHSDTNNNELLVYNRLKNDETISSEKSVQDIQQSRGCQSTQQHSKLLEISTFDKHNDSVYPTKEQTTISNVIVSKPLCSSLMDEVCLSPPELQESLNQKDTSHLLPYPLVQDQHLMKSPLSFDTSSMFGDLSEAEFDNGLYTDIPLHKEGFNTLDTHNDKKEVFSTSFPTFLEQRDWGLMVDVSPMLPDEISQYKDNLDKSNEKKPDYNHVPLSLPDKIIDYNMNLNSCVSEDELEIKRIVTELENQLQTTRLSRPPLLNEESTKLLKMSKFSPLRLKDASENEDTSLDIDCPVQNMALSVSGMPSDTNAEAFAEHGLPWSSSFEFELMAGHHTPNHAEPSVLEQVSEEEDHEHSMITKTSNAEKTHLQQENQKNEGIDVDERTAKEKSEEILESKTYAENLMKSLEVISDSIFKNDPITPEVEEPNITLASESVVPSVDATESRVQNEKEAITDEADVEATQFETQSPLSENKDFPPDEKEVVSLQPSEYISINNQGSEFKYVPMKIISEHKGFQGSDYCPNMEINYPQMAVDTCKNRKLDDCEVKILESKSDLSEHTALLDSTPDSDTKLLDTAIEEHPQIIYTTIDAHLDTKIEEDPEILKTIIDEHPDILGTTTQKHLDTLDSTIDEHPEILDTNIEEHPEILDSTIEEHPEILDSTIEEHPEILDTTIKEHPEILDITIDEQPKILETTIEKHPEILDITIDEQPKILDTTIEKHPEILDTTIEEQPAILGITIDEQPKILDTTIEKHPEILDITIDEHAEILETAIDDNQQILHTAIVEHPEILDTTIDEHPKFLHTIIDEHPEIPNSIFNVHPESTFLDNSIDEKTELLDPIIDEKTELLYTIIDEKTELLDPTIDEKIVLLESNIDENTELLETPIGEHQKLEKHAEDTSLNSMSQREPFSRFILEEQEIEEITKPEEEENSTIEQSIDVHNTSDAVCISSSANKQMEDSTALVIKDDNMQLSNVFETVDDELCNPLLMESNKEDNSNTSPFSNTGSGDEITMLVVAKPESDFENDVQVENSPDYKAEGEMEKPELEANYRQGREFQDLEDIQKKVPLHLMASPHHSPCKENLLVIPDNASLSSHFPPASPHTPLKNPETQKQMQPITCNLVDTILVSVHDKQSHKEVNCDDLNPETLHITKPLTTTTEREYSSVSPSQMNLEITENKISSTEACISSSPHIAIEPFEAMKALTKRVSVSLYDFKLSPMNYNYIPDEPPQLNQFYYTPISPANVDEEETAIKQSPNNDCESCDLSEDTTLTTDKPLCEITTELLQDHIAELRSSDKSLKNSIQNVLCPSSESTSKTMEDFNICPAPLKSIDDLDLPVDLLKRVDPEVLPEAQDIHDMPGDDQNTLSFVKDIPYDQNTLPFIQDIPDDQNTPKPLIICENEPTPLTSHQTELLKVQEHQGSATLEEDIMQKNTNVCEICSMCFRTVPGLKRHKAMKHLTRTERVCLHSYQTSHSFDTGDKDNIKHRVPKISLQTEIDEVSENPCPETSNSSSITRHQETKLNLEDTKTEIAMTMPAGNIFQQIPTQLAKSKKSYKPRKNRNNELNEKPDPFSDELLKILKTDILQAITPEFQIQVKQGCNNSLEKIEINNPVKHEVTKQDKIPLTVTSNNFIEQMPMFPIEVTHLLPPTLYLTQNKPDKEEVKSNNLPETVNGLTELSMFIKSDYGVSVSKHSSRDNSTTRENHFDKKEASEPQTPDESLARAKQGEVSVKTECEKNIDLPNEVENLSCIKSPASPLGFRTVNSFLDDESTFSQLFPTRNEELKRKKCAKVYGKKNKKQKLSPPSPIVQAYPPPELYLEKKDDCRENQIDQTFVNSQNDPCEYETISIDDAIMLNMCHKSTLKTDSNKVGNMKEDTTDLNDIPVNTVEHDSDFLCPLESTIDKETLALTAFKLVTDTVMSTDPTSCKSEDPTPPCPLPIRTPPAPYPGEACSTDNMSPFHSIDIPNLNTTFQLPEIQFIDSNKDIQSARLTETDDAETKDNSKNTKIIERKGRKRQEGGIKIKDKQYKCKVCFTWFLTLGELNFHKLSHNPSPPPTCYMCVQRKFSSREQLRDHLSEKHAKNKAGVWTCGMCLKEISDVWMYNEHLREHATQFARKGQSHSAILGSLPGSGMQESAVKNFITSIMQRRPCKVNRESSKVSNKEKPALLETNGQEAKTSEVAQTKVAKPKLNSEKVGKSSTLMPVEVLHKTEMAPKNVEMHPNCKDPSRDCHHCGKQFPKPFKLQRHLVVHNLNKIFLCHKCPVTYQEPQELKDHLKSEHEELDEPDSKHTTLYTCELCADVMHVIKKSFICSTCNYTFSKKEQFDRHMEKHLSGGNKIFKFRGVLRPIKTSKEKDDCESPANKKRKILTDSQQENSSDSGIASISSLHLNQSVEMPVLKPSVHTTEDSTQTSAGEYYNDNDASVKTEDMAEDYSDVMNHCTFQLGSEVLSTALPKVEDMEPSASPKQSLRYIGETDGKSVPELCDVKEEDDALEGSIADKERQCLSSAKHGSIQTSTAEAENKKLQRNESTAPDGELYVSFSEFSNSEIPEAHELQCSPTRHKSFNVVTDQIRESEQRPQSTSFHSQDSKQKDKASTLKPSETIKHTSRTTELTPQHHSKLTFQGLASSENKDSSRREQKKKKEMRLPHSLQRVSSPSTRENFSVDVKAKNKFRPSKFESSVVHRKSDGPSDYPVLSSMRDDAVSNKIISKHKISGSLGLQPKRTSLDNCTPKKSEIVHHFNGDYKAKKGPLGRPVHFPVSKVSAPPLSNSLIKSRPKTGMRSMESLSYRTAESQNNLLSQLFGQKLTSFKIPLRKDT